MATQKKKTTRIAILIPAYNEELTIAPCIKDMHRHCPEAEIVVINNNSGDATEKIARETLGKLKCPARVINEYAQGKAYAIRRAFQIVDADVFVMTDADTTYEGSDLSRLLEPVLAGRADMVVGDRHATGAYKAENKRSFHGFGNHLVKGIINILFRSDLHDIMSGYRVLSGKFVKLFPILSAGFEIETEMTLHALDKRYRIVEIPIQYKDRPAGSFSKLNTFRDGFRVLSYIFTIFRYYRPFIFFASLGALFFISSLAAGFPVVAEYIQTRFVAHVPLAILSTGLMILSVLSFAIGLILDALAKIHRTQYELLWIRTK
ncbi:MAG: glycosyltransferase family 2 protein [Leptospirales bacterium]|jgi:glycosyltransferase involved in cell wall biosynthesis